MIGTQMHTLRWAVYGILFIAGSLAAASAAEPAAPPQAPAAAPAPMTIADWWFNLIDTKSGKRIGGEHKVMQQQEKSTLVIQDRLAMAQKDASVGYDCTVRYALQPSLAPVSGEVVTNVDGKRFLKGSFKLEGRVLTSTSSLTNADGSVLQPEHTEKGDLPGKGLVLLPQGLEVIAPALLPAEGQRADITLVEFPARLDTMVAVDTGCRLVRSDLPDGSARFQLVKGDTAQLIWQYVLDAKGAIKEGTLYETKFVPATRDEATKPVTAG
jgi:hypothetical protein